MNLGLMLSRIAREPQVKRRFNDRLLGLWRMAVLLHDSSSCWEATVDRNFLYKFCIISCVETTLLLFCIPFHIPFIIPFHVPAFRLSQLPKIASLANVKPCVTVGPISLVAKVWLCIVPVD